MKKAQNIPVIITVSRKTGQVIETKRAEVDRESFRRTCQELLKIGRKEREGAER